MRKNKYVLMFLVLSIWITCHLIAIPYLFAEKYDNYTEQNSEETVIAFCNCIMEENYEVAKTHMENGEKLSMEDFMSFIEMRGYDELTITKLFSMHYSTRGCWHFGSGESGLIVVSVIETKDGFKVRMD